MTIDKKNNNFFKEMEDDIKKNYRRSLSIAAENVQLTIAYECSSIKIEHVVTISKCEVCILDPYKINENGTLLSLNFKNVRDAAKLQCWDITEKKKNHGRLSVRVNCTNQLGERVFIMAADVNSPFSFLYEFCDSNEYALALISTQNKYFCLDSSSKIVSLNEEITTAEKVEDINKSLIVIKNDEIRGQKSKNFLPGVLTFLSYAVSIGVVIVLSPFLIHTKTQSNNTLFFAGINHSIFEVRADSASSNSQDIVEESFVLVGNLFHNIDPKVGLDVYVSELEPQTVYCDSHLGAGFTSKMIDKIKALKENTGSIFPPVLQQVSFSSEQNLGEGKGAVTSTMGAGSSSINISASPKFSAPVQRKMNPNLAKLISARGTPSTVVGSSRFNINDFRVKKAFLSPSQRAERLKYLRAQSFFESIGKTIGNFLKTEYAEKCVTFVNTTIDTTAGLDIRLKPDNHFSIINASLTIQSTSSFSDAMLPGNTVCIELGKDSTCELIETDFVSSYIILPKESNLVNPDPHPLLSYVEKNQPFRIVGKKSVVKIKDIIPNTCEQEKSVRELRQIEEMHFKIITVEGVKGFQIDFIMPESSRVQEIRDQNAELLGKKAQALRDKLRDKFIEKALIEPLLKAGRKLNVDNVLDFEKRNPAVLPQTNEINVLASTQSSGFPQGSSVLDTVPEKAVQESAVSEQLENYSAFLPGSNDQSTSILEAEILSNQQSPSLLQSFLSIPALPAEPKFDPLDDFDLVNYEKRLSERAIEVKKYETALKKHEILLKKHDAAAEERNAEIKAEIKAREQELQASQQALRAREEAIANREAFIRSWVDPSLNPLAESQGVDPVRVLSQKTRRASYPF